MSFDLIALWTGRIILLAGGWLLIAFLFWQAIEMSLKVFRVNKLVLEYYWDKLKANQGTITSKKK